MNGIVFFRRCEVETGCELWRTDGTPGGTGVAVDLMPGPVGSNPELLVNGGGALFFATLDTGPRGLLSNLWATDGTAKGTVRVGGAPLPGRLTAEPVLAGGMLFFRLDDGTHGAELWATSAHGYPAVPRPPACAGGCDDRNPCTQDVCNAAGQCAHNPVAGPCDDGDDCTLNDTCSAGRCVGGEQRACNDGNPCTADSCIPGVGCVNVDVPNACDDGNVCTLDDVCVAGRCRGREPLDCDDGNPCTVDWCDPVRGCVHRPIDSGDWCDDGDRCTLDDHCDGGVCRGTVARDCDDGNPCTLDSCRPDSGCEHVWAVGTCDDGDACTSGDTCQGGVCVGVLDDRECVDAVLCRGLVPPRATSARASSAATGTDAPPSELCSSLAVGAAFTRHPLAEPSGPDGGSRMVFNQFGTSLVETLRGSSALIHAQVAGQAPSAAARGTDGYRCRRVRGTRGHTLAAPHPLTVHDAFTGARRDVVVQMPNSLCTPADPESGHTALLCYRARIWDAVSDARPIVARDRFGTLRAQTTRVQTVCLPSTVLR